MELNADQLLRDTIRDGIREGIKTKLTGYSSPLDKLIDGVLKENDAEFRSLLNEALKSCLSEKAFRADIAMSVRHTLAKTLVQRFGGELERQVNALKSDPSTRARITLAIEEIVKDKCVSV